MFVDPKLYAAEELANAVIIQAAIDYRQAMKDVRETQKQNICLKIARTFLSLDILIFIRPLTEFG